MKLQYDTVTKLQTLLTASFHRTNCKGGGALCAGNAVALLVFGPVMP